jgi:hypothetical protein
MKFPRSSIAIFMVVLLVAGSFVPQGHAASRLSVKIVSLTSPISGGKQATIEVSTAPNASCKIVVTYDSGPSAAKGLEPKTADATGSVSWTWNVGATTTPGKWPVTVTCTSGGRQATAKRSSW